MDQLRESLGDRIRELRKARDMTQEVVPHGRMGGKDPLLLRREGLPSIDLLERLGRQRNTAKGREHGGQFKLPHVRQRKVRRIRYAVPWQNAHLLRDIGLDYEGRAEGVPDAVVAERRVRHFRRVIASRPAT